MYAGAIFQALPLQVFKSRVVCPEIMLTNTHTNEKERAGNRGHVATIT